MKKYIFTFLISFLFISCINTEIFPTKEYEEEFPIYINNNIFLEGVFFNNIYQSNFLLFWNIEYRYVKGDGIGAFIYYDSSYFPLDTTVNLKKVKLKMCDKSEFISTDIKVIENPLYHEGKNKNTETYEMVYDKKSAPKGYVGNYQVEADFGKMIKLKNINEIEFYIDIEENGVRREIIKILHANFKYKTKTRTIFGKWVSSF